jgi:hypothetical protein
LAVLTVSLRVAGKVCRWVVWTADSTVDSKAERKAVQMADLMAVPKAVSMVLH